MNGSRRTAVITGAGSGIGAAVAAALAAQGFRVALMGRRRQALNEVATRINSAGHEAFAVVADITNPAAVRESFATVVRATGRVDLLFNNAGMSAPAAPLEDVSYEDWSNVMATNLTGTFLCTQEAFRIMKSQRPRGGRIINNGSISATTPRPHAAAYAASKHAVSGLTKTTALEGRQYDIACGQIDIGNAATAIGSHVNHGALQPDGSVRQEPTIELAHVAEAVRYMAGLPLEANVLSLTVMATGMPFVGRG